MATDTYITKKDLVQALRPIRDDLDDIPEKMGNRFSTLDRKMEALNGMVKVLVSNVEALRDTVAHLVGTVSALDSKMDALSDGDQKEEV